MHPSPSLVRRFAYRALGASLLLGALALAGCESASVPFEQTTGPAPVLAAPQQTPIPTVDIAPARGWSVGGTPAPAPGFAVTAFARDLAHPRWLRVLPNGDVLVAETNAPERPAQTGFKAWVMSLVMKRAGAGVPSANRITLLRDADGDGIAEFRAAFLEKLNSPFGMALVGNDLYIANTDAILRFRYVPGTTRIDEAGVKVADLPAGPRNYHWTKNILPGPDGTRLFATVGSNSNVAEHGMSEEAGRAAIHSIDLATGQSRVFASGLRNPNGLAWHPTTGELWTVVNERDELGSDLVPDYLTRVREGAFYGWPHSYYGHHVDRRVEPPRPDLVARAVVPDYALGSHVAPLGLAFATGTLLPPRYRHGAFIAQHGSWNRRPPSGYNVVFVPFAEGKPAGKPEVVLDGFLDAEGRARGRPVGVAVDGRGALLVADDVGNTVWRLVPAATR